MASSSQQALPPTRILSSTTVSPNEAQVFLSAFIRQADVDRQSTSRGDLALPDQRRIAQALQGVFIPKPQPENIGKSTSTTAAVAATRLKDTGVTGADSIALGKSHNLEETGSHGDLDNVPTTVDKVQRKMDKKARAKEEKKKRSEERAREKRNS
jgi:hypothetical protein